MYKKTTREKLSSILQDIGEVFLAAFVLPQVILDTTDLVLIGLGIAITIAAWFESLILVYES